MRPVIALQCPVFGDWLGGGARVAVRSCSLHVPTSGLATLASGGGSSRFHRLSPYRLFLGRGFIGDAAAQHSVSSLRNYQSPKSWDWAAAVPLQVPRRTKLRAWPGRLAEFCILRLH